MTALSDLITPSRLSYPIGEPPEGVDVLWRVDAKSYSYVVDPEQEIYGVTAPRLEMTWWKVARWTRCGARLEWGKFVILDDKISRRRWACRTQAEALASYIARRERQISLLKGQLRYAEQELALAKAVS